MNLAWQYLEGTNISVFLTGKAGTGKTTFLKKLRERLPKRMVVLAPTGDSGTGSCPCAARNLRTGKNAQ